MEQNNLFDIRIISTIDIEIPNDEVGNIIILGNNESMIQKANEMRFDMINYVDSSTTFYPYKCKIINAASNVCNIVCPIKDPVSNRILYVVANTDAGDLKFAISAVADEAENEMRKLSQEYVAIVALQNPDLYISVIDKVIKGGSALSALSGLTFGGELGAAITHDPILGIAKSALNSISSTITARQKKEAFRNLPKRLNKSFVNQNPEDSAIVRQTMGTFYASEYNAIVQELSRKIPNLLQDFHSLAINAASNYEIYVRKWDEKCKGDFTKNKYHYCIYLKNGKGEEIPVKFKHTPSYCIYMMYILDRYQRGDEVAELKIKELKKEFCGLFNVIMDGDEEKIEDMYNRMSLRVESDGSMRKGRIDDYIKDIHDTMVELVGEIDSIPLKVGHGRYIGIHPERIFIDDKLAKFKIA